MQTSAQKWKREDVSDRDVLRAYWVARTANDLVNECSDDGRVVESVCTPAGLRLTRPEGGVYWAYHVLMAERPGLPFKVAYAAMDRCSDHELLDYGVSLRAGFPTPAGDAVLESMGLRWPRR